MPAAHRVHEAELGAEEVRPRRVRLRLQPPQLVCDRCPALFLDVLLLRPQRQQSTRQQDVWLQEGLQ